MCLNNLNKRYTPASSVQENYNKLREIIDIDKTLLFDRWSIRGLFWLVKKYFAAVLHRKAGANDTVG
jgi:hypothetical protein